MIFGEYIEYLSKEAIKKLWTDYSDIRKARAKELVDLADTFGPADLTVKYYVEPYCQNINPANYDEEEPIAVVKTPIFTFLNDFLNREFKIQGDGRNQMFVLSDAGLGKTSLLLMIKLCELIPRLKRQYNLSKKFKVEILKIGIGTVGHINRLQDKTKTILLLDALDEDKLSWNDPEKRLRKILQAASGFRRVIITCRTQFFPSKGVSRLGESEMVEIGGYRCPIIFLSMFDHRQVHDYLSKRFPKYESSSIDEEKMTKAKAVLEKAHSLSFRPFLLAHIEDIIESDQVNWNEYMVYNELVQIWLRREERKLATKDLTAASLWLACVILALKMQEKGQRYLTRKEFEATVRSMPIVSSLQDIDYGARSLLNRTSAGDFRFSHYTIQEFLIGDFLIKSSGRQDIGQVSHEINKLNINRSLIEITRKALEFVSIAADSEWRNTQPLKLEGANLSGFKFNGWDFQGCSFKNTALRDSVLVGADLRGADFTDATLSHANLCNAQIDRAVFVRTRLDYCNFENASAEKARFEYVEFVATNFKGVANLNPPKSNVRYEHTIMPNGKVKKN